MSLKTSAENVRDWWQAISRLGRGDVMDLAFDVPSERLGLVYARKCLTERRRLYYPLIGKLLVRRSHDGKTRGLVAARKAGSLRGETAHGIFILIRISATLGGLLLL